MVFILHGFIIEYNIVLCNKEAHIWIMFSSIIDIHVYIADTVRPTMRILFESFLQSRADSFQSKPQPGKKSSAIMMSVIGNSSCIGQTSQAAS